MMTNTVLRGAIYVVAAWTAIACVGAGAARAQGVTIAAAGHPITGAPYSSVMEERHTQTLANGTHIDLVTSVTKQYRDAQGRIRQEHYSVRDGETAQTPIMIEIIDPVTGVRYILKPNVQKAESYPLSVGGGQGVVSSSERGAPVVVNGPTRSTNSAEHPEVTQEQLGTDSMLGVEVTGRRTTSVFPVGSRGNDQPITMTIESWRSKELHIEMLRRQDDPLVGSIEWRVTQIDRTEPDASLFQVPPDYTIENRQQ